MKLNLASGFAALLGFATANLRLRFSGWSYNLFRDPFDLWKVVLKLGIPIVAVVTWHWKTRLDDHLLDPRT